MHRRSASGLFCRKPPNPGDADWTPTSGLVITEASAVLTANATTVAQPPLYATLLSVPIVKQRADTVLAASFTAAVLFTGGAGNVAVNLRLRLNGGAFSSGGNGSTFNEPLASRIQPLAYQHPGVSSIAAGAHTVVLEWAYFGPVGRTLSILVVTFPDLMNASLLVQEKLV